MRIDKVFQGINLIQGSKETASNRKPEGHGEQPAETDKREDSVAEVNLSSESVDYSKAAESADQESVERNEKVNQIKMSIEQGTYQVDSGAVADKLLKTVITDLISS